MTKKLKNLFYLILFFSLCFFYYSLPCNALVICDGSYACALTEERDDNGVPSGKIDLFIRNILSYDITVTIEFSELKNISSSVSLPYTLTVPGGRTLKILTMQTIDINKEIAYNFKYYAVEGNVEASHDNNYVYKLPFASGRSYLVTQGFNGEFSHRGEQKYAIDWKMTEGTEVYAARDGTVVGIKSDSSKGGFDKKYSPFANYIIIQHSDGTFGAYLHLKKNGAKVSPGQRVKAGELIGLSGNTGWSGAPHLHFWVYKAKNGRERESFPIRFKTDKEDSAILLEGNYYTAP